MTGSTEEVTKVDDRMSEVVADADSHVLTGAVTEQVLPTNLGRTVSVVRTPSGKRYLLKAAATPHWRAELLQQSTHFDVLRDYFGATAPYPRVIELGPAHMVMEFYDGGSLDDLAFSGDRTDVEHLVEELLELYLHLSFDSQSPIDAEAGSELARLATSFTGTQVRSRISRLEEAVLRFPAFVSHRPPWSESTRGDVIAGAASRIESWSTSAGIHQVAPLRLSVHGDLGLNNVLLRSTRDRSLVLIDTRGIWIDGRPWWDPLLDLATLLVFHCRVDPTLAACDPGRRPIHHGSGRISEDRLRSIVEAACERHDVNASVPDWRERLELYIAVRLLGAVSVQVLSAPREPELLADAMLRLLVEHLDATAPPTRKNTHEMDRP
jgi:aminoglycoside phosphotransferase (APT) family kinase protein